MFCGNCGRPLMAGAQHCGSCGRAVQWQPLQRQGSDLVVWRGTSLPMLCVKCGSKVHRDPVRRRFYWHAPVLYLTILAGVIVYAIVALIVRKQFELAVPLCDQHFARRRLWLGIGLALMLIAFPVLIVGVANDYTGSASLFCLFSFLVGAVIFASFLPILRPTRITDEMAVFKGASDEFLRRLPLDMAETFA